MYFRQCYFIEIGELTVVLYMLYEDGKYWCNILSYSSPYSFITESDWTETEQICKRMIHKHTCIAHCSLNWFPFTRCWCRSIGHGLDFRQCFLSSFLWFVFYNPQCARSLSFHRFIVRGWCQLLQNCGEWIWFISNPYPDDHDYFVVFYLLFY